MLIDVDIDNFRGFGALRLKGLGRVNLVVGKNNTGKTSLLEAVAAVVRPRENVVGLPRLFRAGDEAVDDRFYGWLLRDGAGQGVTCVAARDAHGVERKLTLTLASTGFVKGDNDFVIVKSDPSVWVRQPNAIPAPLTMHAVPVHHREPDSMVDAFAEAVRAPVDERQMESLLASVDPRIKSVRLDAVQSKPFVVVDVGLSNRVPLSQAGQGIYRLVAIFSELLGRKPNLCFIDEIERLDVQVFATTHSRECLLAAHEAFSARATYDLRVVQLYRLGEETSGRVLDREHIEAAVTGDIEVR
jgi:hypothetical protein